LGAVQQKNVVAPTYNNCMVTYHEVSVTTINVQNISLYTC